MSLTAKVLIALAAGMSAGILIAGSGNAALLALPGYLEPVGTIWVNALRMTVIPLVVSAILIGINSLPDARTIGRIGGRAIALFLVTLIAAALFAVVVGPPLLAMLPLDANAVEALRQSTATASSEAVASAQKLTGFRQWLIDLVPTNPIKAAADGAMLPLIIFTVLFGLALTRTTAPNREQLMKVIQGVFEAALTLVRWVLWAAPIGVFALTVALATRLGLAAAGAVIYYVVAVALLLTAFMAILYVVAWLLGGKAPRLFARACGPAQAVAFSSRSSLVALPAMLETTDTVLKLPMAIRSFFLPLAVATFRIGSAIGIPMGVLFLARLYGIDLNAAQLATIALTSVVTTFSVPGIPGGSIIVMVPVMMGAGVPVDGVGLLLAVDTIPDMFRTTTNVTGDMAVATVLGRYETDAGAPTVDAREIIARAGVHES